MLDTSCARRHRPDCFADDHKGENDDARDRIWVDATLHCIDWPDIVMRLPMLVHGHRCCQWHSILLPSAVPDRVDYHCVAGDAPIPVRLQLAVNSNRD
jgi:hypothetical protein